MPAIPDSLSGLAQAQLVTDKPPRQRPRRQGVWRSPVVSSQPGSVGPPGPRFGKIDGAAAGLYSRFPKILVRPGDDRWHPGLWGATGIVGPELASRLGPFRQGFAAIRLAARARRFERVGLGSGTNYRGWVRTPESRFKSRFHKPLGLTTRLISNREHNPQLRISRYGPLPAVRSLPPGEMLLQPHSDRIGPPASQESPPQRTNVVPTVTFFANLPAGMRSNAETRNWGGTHGSCYRA